MATKDVNKDVEDYIVPSGSKLFTKAQVAKHNDPKDTWIIIHNNVYDVTSFLDEHPGGEEILVEQGGNDASELFEDIEHSIDARKLMNSFKIGELIEEEKRYQNVEEIESDCSSQFNEASKEEKSNNRIEKSTESWKGAESVVANRHSEKSRKSFWGGRLWKEHPAIHEMATKDVKDVKDDTASSGSKLFTRAEVAKHADPKDTWIIIHNNVYNVTSFLNEHPGGEEVLLEQGGNDATEPFEDIGHSTDARLMMESFKIGELIEEERTKDNEKKERDWSSGGADEDNSSRCCIVM
ncbi:cytochrome b5 domain-containing protein RLF-like isoform X2 [Nylanderia fulva]|uniref:cytochrome b5 domain-containing protein RLF-like isoform X2 n=1 Tax=Nylanderia fulva TaxID=613905 RepID=UPI0010FB4C9C|nr:cytochrome b5 domain-containing protein RLF-like isoform X2 [Nylanderia fulva]